jgi:hypothetical protein
MKWFDNWFRKKCMEAWNSDSESDESIVKERDQRSRRGVAIGSRSSPFDHTSSSLESKGMRFHLYKAVGGHILETHVYNERNDTTEHTLYMINDDGDFAKQVSQAILIESMKQ